MFSGDATVDGSLALASGAHIVCHVDDFLQSTAGTLTVTGGFTLPEGVESVLDLVTVPGGEAVYEKSLSADGKTITVSKSGGSDFTWNGDVSANWDDQNAWMSDGTAANWADGGRALFAPPDATVTLGGSDVSAASVAFDADTVINGTSSLAAPVVHVASGRRTAGGFVGADDVFDAGTLRANIRGHGALVAAAALDGADLSESSRILVWHPTDLHGTGFAWGGRVMKDGHPHTGILSWGNNRLLAHVGEADVSLALADAQLRKVYALGTDGRREHEIPARVESGRLSFTASVRQPFGGCLYYEIVTGLQ